MPQSRSEHVGEEKHFMEIYTRIMWVSCHHGMARLQVADRGDGLQI